MNILTVEELTLGYGLHSGETAEAVSAVSFALDDGEVLGIAGESGCGKSTLALGLLGFLVPPLKRLGGRVVVDDVTVTNLAPQDLRRLVLGTRMALIPQSALNALNPTRRLRDLAKDIMRSHGCSLPAAHIREHVARRFDALGLNRRALDAYPCELSGGMKQRAVIALSTLLDPRVVIADEPTSALDVSTQKTVLTLLLDLLHRRVIGSMILITHELPLLYHVADRIAVMYAGQIVELGAAEQVIRQPRHPYTQALMEAMLLAEPGTRGPLPKALPGAPPRLGEMPEGCRFAPRCPRAVAHLCGRESPQLRSVATHWVRCHYAE